MSQSAQWRKKKPAVIIPFVMNVGVDIYRGVIMLQFSELVYIIGAEFIFSTLEENVLSALCFEFLAVPISHRSLFFLFC